MEDMMRFLTHPRVGGIATFIGTTRDHHRGKAVSRLEYDGHEGLAVKVMNAVALDASIRSAAPLEAIYIAHRLGCVEITQASVLVGVSAAHRAEALEAVRFIIDEVKARVPVWKKEWYADGTFEWKENCECTWGRSASKQSNKLSP